MSKSPAKLFPLWDVDDEDDVIVTTSGCLLRVVEVIGFDPTQTTDDVWAQVADGLYAGVKSFPDYAYLQFILEDRAVEREDLEAAEHSGDEPMLAYQKKRRAEYLLNRGMRKTTTYAVFGSSLGLTNQEFKNLREETHQSQLSTLREVEGAVQGALQRIGLKVGRLDAQKILKLFRSSLEPGGSAPTIRRSPTFDGLRSIREQLIPGDIRWDPNHVKVASKYFKVLACKTLLPTTELRSLAKIVRPEWNHRLVIHMHWPNQASVKNAFGQRRKFIHAATKDEGPSDEDQEAAREGADGVAKLLAKDGQKLVKVGLQAVVWANDAHSVDARAIEMARAFENIDVRMFEEANAHDFELFKSLPGMGLNTFDRWRLVTSNVAADLIPLDSYASGDPDGTLQLQIADTAELFRWTPTARVRANSNFLILGASGSGKSVLTNLIVATSMLSGRDRGRILAVDYAGPTKSSLKVAAEIFGGSYVSISDSGHKINPWPKAKVALRDGVMISGVLAYLIALLNILLHNEENNKDCALFEAIIQNAVRTMYRSLGPDTEPRFEHLKAAFESFRGQKDVDQRRLEELLGLLNKFLGSPGAAILNSRTTAPSDGRFLVYDLYGLKSYEKTNLPSAVAMVVANHVRNIAFDDNPALKKYILFEEAANLLGVGMKDAMEELFTTARAHGTTVGTITQEYEKYVRSGVAGVINLNTTTRIFLSHQNAANAIKPIIRDFDLNDSEAAAFRSLNRVKGEFSEALFKTESVGPGGVGIMPVTAKVGIYLSPFDYQMLTSDADDRAQQLELSRKHPEASRMKILDYLAHRRSQPKGVRA